MLPRTVGISLIILNIFATILLLTALALVLLFGSAWRPLKQAGVWHQESSGEKEES